MYKFNLSVSDTGSRLKEEINFNKIQFETKNLSVEDLINYIKSGHTFCYVFNSPKFHISDKKIKNFSYTNVIGIDIDDSTIPMNDYVSNLKYKPSICYTSYSNGLKGYRFRLIYIFNDKITDNYKTVYNAILKSNGIELKDNCMSSEVQCFIGNGKENVEVINNNRIYNVSEFSDFFCNVQHPECKNKIIPNNNTTVNTLILHSGCSVNDYISMSFEDYYNKYKDTYRQFSSTDLEFNEEGYALIDDNYISIYRKYQWITDEKGNRICIKIKWHDGEKRWRKLFCSAMLRRKINNDVTFDELLFNTAVELEYYYFNDDNRFSKNDVLRIVQKVMSFPIDKVNTIDHFKDKRRFALDSTKYQGRNEKASARQRINKKLKYEEISKYYNPKLKDKENLEILKEKGISITRQTLSNFKKEMGIKKITKNEEIGSMYDPSLSDKENVEIMRSYGLNVTTDDLCKWRFHNNVKKLPVIASNESNDNLYQEEENKQTETITEANTEETDRIIAEISKRMREEEKINLFDMDMYSIFRPLQMHLINHTDRAVKEYGIKRMEKMIKNINNSTILFEFPLNNILDSTNKHLYKNLAV